MRMSDTVSASSSTSRQERGELVRAFLRACLRSRWDPERLSTGLELAARAGFDWDSVRQAAVREGVGPLLYSIVRGRGMVPHELEQELRVWYLQNMASNMKQFQELAAVLRSLRNSNIPVLVLKGAALADAVYGNIGLRPMTDVDLLVQREQLQHAKQVLGHLGYRSELVETKPGAQVEEHHAEGLVKRGEQDVVMGIHWRLFDSPYYRDRLRLEWFWDSALAVEIEGEPARILGVEAQILHLCGHLVLHHGRGERWRLIWLHDVAEVIARYGEQINWEAVLDRAGSCELVVPVRLVLTRLAAEWGVAVPRWVLGQLDDLRASPEQERLYAWRTSEKMGVAQRFWADLAGISGWRARARYAWIQAFPSRAYMEHRYRVPSAALLPLYYPYRWLVGLSSALRPRG